METDKYRDTQTEKLEIDKYRDTETERDTEKEKETNT